MTTPSPAQQWQNSLFDTITANQAVTHDALTRAQQDERDALRAWLAAHPYPTQQPPVQQPPVQQPPVQQPPVQQPPTGTLTNLPAQPGMIAYGGDTGIAAYAKPGGLVIASRGNYSNSVMKAVSAAGGHVLIYLDAIINSASGRYHQLLLQQSQFGPAVPQWPGNPKANQWGYLNDFRVGSILQSKLEGVLELMVTENPHMAGFFADDLGSRSWFPGFNWDGWGSTNQQAYRDGAIGVAKTFRKVANKHGLIVMVNGTWGSASSVSGGGGYPSMSVHGCSLADGGSVEHHSASELPYWTAYAGGSQWAKESTVTNGKPFMLAITSTSTADRDAYARSNKFAWVAPQQDYGTYPTPWAPFHPTGLPSKV